MNRTQRRGQECWNGIGSRRLAEIEQDPERFLVEASPHAHCLGYRDLTRTLGKLEGRKVLELGCGRGTFSVFMAKQGARVTGVDIGPALIASCRKMAAVNQVECRFQNADVVLLPFASNEFDLVIGIGVLHHLSEADVEAALCECHRVLADTGRAVFYEPVENSRLFELLQNIVPIRNRGNSRSRPSILQRSAWKRYIAQKDERALTNRELRAAGHRFRTVTLRKYGFLVRLRKLLGARARRHLIALDEWLFRLCPPLKVFCKMVLVEYRKS
jgi:ubiquinone/menaquinone biosynthesis C-methylase UbiE